MGVVVSWKLLDSQTVLLDSWLALLDLNVHLVRRLADVGSVPASSNALREGYLCVSGNMCGIIMQHLAPSHWTPCPQEQRQGDSPKQASLCAREIWRLTDGDWWHLATISFFWVVMNSFWWCGGLCSMVSKVFYGKSGSCANFRYLMKWMAWTGFIS